MGLNAEPNRVRDEDLCDPTFLQQDKEFLN